MGEFPVKASNEDKQDTSSSEMLACCWEGKENIQIRRVPRPDITDDEDVFIRVTGSTGMLQRTNKAKTKTDGARPLRAPGKASNQYTKPEYDFS